MSYNAVENRWTTPAGLREQVQRLWNKGTILSSIVSGECESVHDPLFPLRLRLTVPTSREITDNFDDVRRWIASLSETPQIRLVTRSLRHRVFGNNEIPDEVWVDTIRDASLIINVQDEVEQFQKLVQYTASHNPKLLDWVAQKPLQSLALHDKWSRLLSVVEWLVEHPRPNIYVRQVDLPGVDTKFIEEHSSLVNELFEAAANEDALCTDPRASFARKFGFLEKPNRIRFRILDSTKLLFLSDYIHDVTVDSSTFSELDIDVRNVFITENEVNFLAFTALPDSMVVLGGGYGLDDLCRTPWLRNKSVFYWGDIDTHGFAILNAARSYLPNTTSILMDESTLLYHRTLWVDEPSPHYALSLPNLTPDELEVFKSLRERKHGLQVRLEQERIGWNYAWQRITSLAFSSHQSVRENWQNHSRHRT